MYNWGLDSPSRPRIPIPQNLGAASWGTGIKLIYFTKLTSTPAHEVDEALYILIFYNIWAAGRVPRCSVGRAKFEVFNVGFLGTRNRPSLKDRALLSRQAPRNAGGEVVYEILPEQYFVH